MYIWASAMFGMVASSSKLQQTRESQSAAVGAFFLSRGDVSTEKLLSYQFINVKIDSNSGNHFE